MVPFEPLLRSPHLQTIASHFWRRPDAAAEFPTERRLYRTEPDVQVLVCSQRPRGVARGEIFMVHGLEGSGDAGYIRSLSTAALRAGFAAHRFHMRTCGGTEHLCQTLYHAGLTSDLLAVLREFRRQSREPAFLAGFSLGGNVVLKLAGEMGESARDYVQGVCSVSAPLDLAASARRIGERDNRVYEARLVRRTITALSPLSAISRDCACRRYSFKLRTTRSCRSRSTNRRRCGPIRGSNSSLPNTAATWDSSGGDPTACGRMR
jgi:predicted alpha/beta-fold hydrolase